MKPVAHDDVPGEKGARGESLVVERSHDDGEDARGQEPGEESSGVSKDEVDEDRPLDRRRKVDVSDDAQHHARNPHHHETEGIERDGGPESAGGSGREPVAEEVREDARGERDEQVRHHSFELARRFFDGEQILPLREGGHRRLQAFDLGLTKKYKWAGDGAIAESTNLPALGNKIEGFVGVNRYVPVLAGVLDTPSHKKFFDEAVARLKEIDPSGPLPDRYVQSNFEGMNALKLGMQKSGFRGREDTMKLIEALEGLEMKEGDDFPQGDKLLRKEDHQAFLREFVFELRGGKYKILDVVPKEKTIVPANCRFA